MYNIYYEYFYTIGGIKENIHK